MKQLATVFMSTMASLFLFTACGDDDLEQIPNEPPLAEIQPLDAVLVGEVLTFDGSLSSDPDGEIKVWSWDVGGGQLVEGEAVSHIFNEAGLYTVTLTVTDDRGASDTASVSVSVDDSQPPVAVVEADAAAALGVNIRFDGTGSYDPDGSVSTWDWDFGDGQTGAGAIIDHSFGSSGTFAVTLTVTDDDGLTDTVLHQVTVQEPPEALSLDGTWQWSLVDATQYDLGGTCGTFQDSMLQITVNEPSISIVEQAGSISVDYNGTINMTTLAFETVHAGLLSEQFITGTFTSSNTFEGEYAIEVAFGDPCDTREVVGVKIQ